MGVSPWRVAVEWVAVGWVAVEVRLEPGKVRKTTTTATTTSRPAAVRISPSRPLDWCPAGTACSSVLM
jgi:hypothetical protein